MHNSEAVRSYNIIILSQTQSNFPKESESFLLSVKETQNDIVLGNSDRYCMHGNTDSLGNLIYSL